MKILSPANGTFAAMAFKKMYATTITGARVVA